MAEAKISVLVTSGERVLFDGTATNLTFPGQQGTFEVLPMHRPLVTRLRAGKVTIDERSIAIRHGVVRVADDAVTAVVEIG